MKANELDKHVPDDPMWRVAQAVEGSVRTIRKARGKLNPEDCTPGTLEYEVVTMEFLDDCIRSLGGDPDADDEEDDSFGAGAMG
ncbi:hypothetical protein [Paraburkholderia hospita]|jgi:hypothetical protein|uniref:hypothetical protein n=1 Tax=Paraburkholderia hospita TaxID=169430 RepID=UPI0009A7FE5B|nr:hypothetical protein [Paraburkholderia hospita]OUL92603.1 hypothetical protein CA603_13175 [Paraburkholderia hospita]SKC88642.1 hypothetical protein SAMN05445504_5443 [Burkholderia sp. CF099]